MLQLKEDFNLKELFKNSKYEPKKFNERNRSYKDKINLIVSDKFRNSPVNLSAVKNKFMRDKYNDFDFLYNNNRNNLSVNNEAKKDPNLFWQQLNIEENYKKILNKDTNRNFSPMKDSTILRKLQLDFNAVNFKVNLNGSPYNHREYFPVNKDFYYVKDEIDKYAEAVLKNQKLVRKDNAKNKSSSKKS